MAFHGRDVDGLVANVSLPIKMLIVMETYCFSGESRNCRLWEQGEHRSACVSS